MRIFVVTRSHGPKWSPSQPLERQARWDEHAVFMDALHDEGFVLLAGPLEGTDDAMLVVRADDEADIEKRLRDDPWENDFLITTTIRPWTVRLGKLT